jgi:hypothetical protein
MDGKSFILIFWRLSLSGLLLVAIFPAPHLKGKQPGGRDKSSVPAIFSEKFLVMRSFGPRPTVCSTSGPLTEFRAQRTR